MHPIRISVTAPASKNFAWISSFFPSECWDSVYHQTGPFHFLPTRCCSVSECSVHRIIESRTGRFVKSNLTWNGGVRADCTHIVTADNQSRVFYFPASYMNAQRFTHRTTILSVLHVFENWSLTHTEENRSRAFGNKVLRTFIDMRQRKWQKVNYEIYRMRNFIIPNFTYYCWIIGRSSVRWAAHVADIQK
jgi:hypothetical protein